MASGRLTERPWYRKPTVIAIALFLLLTLGRAAKHGWESYQDAERVRQQVALGEDYQLRLVTSGAEVANGAQLLFPLDLKKTEQLRSIDYDHNIGVVVLSSAPWATNATYLTEIQTIQRQDRLVVAAHLNTKTSSTSSAALPPYLLIIPKNEAWKTTTTIALEIDGREITVTNVTEHLPIPTK